MTTGFLVHGPMQRMCIEWLPTSTSTPGGGVKGRTQVPQLVERWLAGDIDVESLLSHRLELDEVNRGFELMEAQDGIRSVIQFS